MKPAVLLAAALLAFACKSDKKKDDPATEPKTAEGVATDPADQAETAAMEPDLSAWESLSSAASWEGSWLAKENGTIQAWTVTGDKVQTWDGEEEKTYSLVIEAPCRAGFKDDSGATYPRNFSVVDGKLRFGGGGFRRGPEAIFCDSSGAIYTVDAAGACAHWKREMGEWKKSEGECGIKSNDEGAEVFFHGDPNAGEWAIEGDAIVPDSSFPTEPVEGDFAAAKTARDSRAAE